MVPIEDMFKSCRNLTGIPLDLFKYSPPVEHSLTILTREEHIPVLYDVLHAIQKWKEFKKRNYG